MVREMALIETVDLSDASDLLRLAQEVRATGRPRVLRYNGEDLAILAPPPTPHESDGEEGAIAAGSVVARTAGVLKNLNMPYLSIEDEKAAFERGDAEQVMESMRD